MKKITLLAALIFAGFGAEAQTCQADFVQDSSFCPSVSYTDQSTSSSTIVGWYWDFGDGTTSNAQNGAHTYTADGNYTVCLTTISSDSCTSTSCQPISINCIGGGGGSVCQADFVQDSSICPSVAFTDQSTASTSIIGWYWNFGDGTTLNSPNGAHTYTADGNYTVCLTTLTADSCTSTYCQSVNINCIGGVGNPCSASFTTAAYADSNGIGTIFYVLNTSTVNPGTSYFWDFGDGSTSTAQHPIHDYLADGTYVLCLTISDSSCTSTYCDTVVVTGSANGFTLVAKPIGSAGLDNLELYTGVNLFPNPTNHNLTLTMNSLDDSEIQVAIVNVMGQVISNNSHQVTSGDNSINLYTDDLMKGYYFVKISSSNGESVEAIRFIKN